MGCLPFRIFKIPPMYRTAGKWTEFLTVKSYDHALPSRYTAIILLFCVDVVQTFLLGSQSCCQCSRKLNGNIIRNWLKKGIWPRAVDLLTFHWEPSILELKFVFSISEWNHWMKWEAKACYLLEVLVWSIPKNGCIFRFGSNQTKGLIIFFFLLQTKGLFSVVYEDLQHN